MGTLTTDVPASGAGSKRGGTDNLESEAIGLDVSVRIHGSQVAAVVLDTTEHVEPFEEDTSTMIVFPRGAVVKLRARVRTGHAVVLTHLATKQTALCRIIQVNSAANVAHYVKLEFIQPAPGFWGVHFPSDEHSPAATQESPAPIEKEIEKLDPVAPVKNVAPAPVSVSRMDAPLAAQKPVASEAVKERETVKDIAKPSPAPTPLPVSYGISEDVHANEVVPLAAAPPKRMPVAPVPKAHPAAAPAPPPHSGNLSAEAPIFDSLSTGEEVFGKEAATIAEETAILKSDQKAAQAFVRSLDPSSILQSGEAPKHHRGVRVILSIAAAAILAAGAVYYAQEYRRNTRESANAITPTSIPQTPRSAAPSVIPAQSTVEPPTPSAPETQSPTGPLLAAKHTPIQTVAESTITVTPARNTAKNSILQSHVTISNGIANIYAGDLAARPQVTQRSNIQVAAPLPTIDNGSKNLAANPGNAQLGSLVGGSASALPTPVQPVEPKPVVRGGLVTPPRLITRVNPSYPPLAVSNHIEGDVEIQADINQNGKVTSTKVISGPGLLRSAAMNAVRQWKYSPATLDGKPITMQYKVTVRFRLGQ
jgi:TonB family protein